MFSLLETNEARIEVICSHFWKQKQHKIRLKSSSFPFSTFSATKQNLGSIATRVFLTLFYWSPQIRLSARILQKKVTHRWGRISRIWLISITVGNAAYPAKKQTKKWTHQIHQSTKRERVAKCQAKFILDSIGMSSFGSFAASREQWVVKLFFIFNWVALGWDLKPPREICDRDVDKMVQGRWESDEWELRGGDNRRELEKAEAAIV